MKRKESFSDRLSEALVSKGISIEEAAEYLNVSEEELGRWLAGTALPDAFLAEETAVRLSVNPEWLLPAPKAAEPITATKKLSLRIVGKTTEAVERLLPPLPFSKDGVPDLVKVDTDEMAPTLMQGDVCLIDRSVRTVTESGLYLIRTKKGSVIRRVQCPTAGNTLILSSDNPLYRQAESVRADQLRVLGRAEAAIHIRTLK